MSNPHVMQRLKELFNMFRTVDSGGSTLSAASKDADRELPIQIYINQENKGKGNDYF